MLTTRADARTSDAPVRRRVVIVWATTVIRCYTAGWELPKRCG